jgi:formiminotetrahydrofolate cyclodeaminase
VLAREIGQIGNTNARSDARVAEELARTAVVGAVENVRVNIASLSDPKTGERLLEEAENLYS